MDVSDLAALVDTRKPHVLMIQETWEGRNERYGAGIKGYQCYKTKTKLEDGLNKKGWNKGGLRTYVTKDI